MEKATPKLKAVRADGDRQLVVTWKGGRRALSMSKHIRDYEVFAPLRRDDALFRAVTIGEWGWCCHWSDDLEITSDTLWRLALEQGGSWLRAWRTARNFTQAEAAAALGVSPRRRYYEAGSHLLPKTLRLAAIGLDAQAHAA